MSIFYRTSNCTLVNVVQSEPKFYRNTFSYMPTMNTSMHELPVQSYTQESQKIGRIPHWPVDTHGGNYKTTHVHLFPNYNEFLLFSFIHSGDGFMEIILCIS